MTRARWLARLVLLAALVATTARANESFRTIVRVANGTDEVLLDRVKGQTVDLGLDVVEMRGRLESRIPEQFAAAEEEAARRHARVVVWFQTADEALFVYILVPETGRLLLRKLAAPAHARSVAFEQAALLVRLALRALAAGASIGVAREEALREAEPPDTMLPPPPPEEPRPPPTPAPAPTREPEEAKDPGLSSPSMAPVRPRSATWTVDLGPGASYDGHMIVPHLATRGAVVANPWELGLALRLGAPVEWSASYGTVRLVEHAATLNGGIAFDPVAPLHLCVCFQAGVAMFQRATVDTAPGVTPVAARASFAGLFGPEVRAVYRVPVAGGWAVGFGLVAALDVYTAIPQIGARSPSRPNLVDTRDLWTAQPRGQAVIELTALP